MKYRKFDGRDISLLGFGLMRLPVTGGDKSKIDYAQARAMVDAAIKNGVNYFDTAYPYHEGMSEVFAGDVLSGYPRDSYYLASKIPSWLVKDAAHAEEIFDGQLKKCKTDRFDFYLIHDYHKERVDHCEAFGLYDVLQKKQAEGKIGCLGMSIHDTLENMTRTMGLHDWDFVQLQLNYMDWDMLDMKSQFQVARDMGVPVIVMEPLRGGALAWLDGTAAAMLKDAEPELSIASWAVRFAMSLPNVVTILSGMSSMEQVEDNLHTIDLEKPFGEKERALVMQASDELISNGTIPCTACNYCMDCPSGVDIPKMFALYNAYCIRESPGTYGAAYYNIGEGKQAHNCVACGVCEPLCPQGIPIMDNMKLIAETVDGLDL